MAAEGLSLARGDVVTITHSLIDGGAAGRLIGGSADRVILDRAVDLSAPPGATDPGAAPMLLLRLLDGTVHRSAVSRAPGGAPDGAPGSNTGAVAELVLATPLPAAPGADDANPRDILWRLYDDALPPVRARIVAVRPSGDRHVRFVAIDEVDAYYRLATSDLSAPFPQPVSRIPHVLDVSFAARRTRVGRGVMVELEATLTVGGDWRGATVRAGPDFNNLAVVARLVDGATVARWLVPPETGQAVEIVPGTEAAPAGPRFRATWMLDAGIAPAAPTDFAVAEAADGTRVYSWTPPAAPDLEGIAIRYAADAAAAWADMTPLHAGFLTSSPHETLEPPAGTYTFAARAVSTSGLESDSATVRVTLGTSRIAGQRWHVGSGPPDAALGVDGDLYLDTDDSTIWRKAAGAWAQIADLSAADGARWFTGADLPAPTLGQDGDWYFRTANAGLYRKAGGAWTFVLDIDGADGATWHSGAGVPGPAIGAVGDWFFRTDNGYVYEKTAATVWTFRRDLTGPQGIAGATWHTGAGAPAASLGVDDDLYFDATDATVWQKASGAWSQVADLSGADGARWFTGAGLPASTLGADGDWYFRTSNAGLYLKVGGTWEFQLDIDGADGAVWHSDTGAPASSLGAVGDWYFRTDNGFVYEKTAAAVWTFRRDLTGPQGIAGATWLSGERDPSTVIGNDGDFYLRTGDSSVWQKDGGTWTRIAELAGTDGSRWFTGSGLPSTVIGQDGDWYFRTSNAGLYLKVSGAWEFQLDIDGADGAVWHSGTGTPSTAVGAVGDWFFRTDNGFVYEKTAAAVWTFRRDLTGPQGIAGATWLSGERDPSTVIGNDGDFYLRTGDSSVWQKDGGTWTRIAELAGADGADWFTGFGLPSTVLGEDGDWYFRTSNAGLYRKEGGAWEFQLDIDGEDGAVWHSGTGLPSTAVGAVGDWFFRTDNGFVYEKTAAAVWTFRRDLTGPQGPQGSQGQPGDPASRGPNVYHYQITLADFALLQAEPTVLPPSLVAIADGATLGDNVHGDWIRFWRPGFNQYWTWNNPAAEWRRAEGWIGAAEIVAVNIQAIAGDFRDIDVTGTLAAEHIDADVRNVKVLWSHSVGVSVETAGYTATLSEAPDEYDYLEFVLEELNPEISPFGLGAIPVGHIHVGSRPSTTIPPSPTPSRAAKARRTGRPC